jgi:hypothetical protein
MFVHFLKGPFDGFETDTETMLLRTLETVSELGEHCATDHDIQMLLMAFDIIKRVELVTYQ